MLQLQLPAEMPGQPKDGFPEAVAPCNQIERSKADDPAETAIQDGCTVSTREMITQCSSRHEHTHTHASLKIEICRVDTSGQLPTKHNNTSTRLRPTAGTLARPTIRILRVSEALLQNALGPLTQG